MFKDEELDLTLEDEVENVENTTEEIKEPEEDEPETMFTEDEVNKRVDKILAAKIARSRDKVRKEYEEKEKPLRELGDIVMAGLGIDNIEDATENLKAFYKEKGVTIPERTQSFSQDEMKVLAHHEASQIIESGMDDVVEEVNRLASKGAEQMTDREKAVFSELAKYRQNEERKKEFLKTGATEEVVGSREFEEFAEQFNDTVPPEKIYNLYKKSTGQQEKPPASIGSMKGSGKKEPKTFYTSEEVDKMSSSDLDDPKVLKAVMDSMSKW